MSHITEDEMMPKAIRTTPSEAYNVGYRDGIIQAQITFIAALNIINDMPDLTKGEALLQLMDSFYNRTNEKKNENTTH